MFPGEAPRDKPPLCLVSCVRQTDAAGAIRTVHARRCRREEGEVTSEEMDDFLTDTLFEEREIDAALYEHARTLEADTAGHVGGTERILSDPGGYA